MKFFFFAFLLLSVPFQRKQQPLDQSHTNENGGFGFGSGLPGGQLLSTALGVTRAVTQFLGSALQVYFQFIVIRIGDFPLFCFHFFFLHSIHSVRTRTRIEFEIRTPNKH